MSTLISMAKILEVSRVAPLTGDSLSDFSLPLTFFDILWLKASPVQRVFFYGLSERNPSSFFFDSVLPNLKKSLSLALTHFLPVAGTLVFPPNSSKPVVHITKNDTVSFTVAQSDANFDALSGDQTREAVSLHSLVPELISSENRSPVMSLKVTLFPAKGFCIGVANNHAVLDGRSVTMFVKSWAHLCKEDRPLPVDLTPSYDRSVIRDPAGLDTLYLKQGSDLMKLFEQNSALGPDDRRVGLVRATFTFTRNDIAKLREKILLEGELRLSSFVISYTYALLCIVGASEQSRSKVIFGFVADFRSRVKPPVPANYFGNCVGVLTSSEDTRKVVANAGEARLKEMAKRVSELIKCKLECDDVLQGAGEWLTGFGSMIAPAADGTPSQPIGVAGSPRFGLYEVDFGWGRPRKLEVVSIDESGALSMAESREGDGGIEIGVVLMRREMEIFASLFRQGLK